MINRKKRHKTIIVMIYVLIFNYSMKIRADDSNLIHRIVTVKDNMYSVWRSRLDTCLGKPSNYTLALRNGYALIRLNLKSAINKNMLRIPLIYKTDPRAFPAWFLAGDKFYGVCDMQFLGQYAYTIYKWQWSNISPWNIYRPPVENSPQLAWTNRSQLCRVEPIEGLIMGYQPISANQIALSRGIVLWIRDANKLKVWKYNPDKINNNSGLPTIIPKGKRFPGNTLHWDYTGEYYVDFAESFEVIYAPVPLVLTYRGNLFRLVDGKTRLLTNVWNSANGDKPDTIEPTSSQLSNSSRLVLLELQDQNKYALLRWDAGKLAPLDVQDKNNLNIEPFLPAKDVGPQIIKATSVMMKQMEKDEEEVAKLKIKQEAERKAKLAEEAKKPKSQTLQQRLQQN